MSFVMSPERMQLDISNLVGILVVMSTTMCVLKYRSIWVYSGWRDLIKFWKISAYISEKAHDRDIVTMEE